MGRLLLVKYDLAVQNPNASRDLFDASIEILSERRIPIAASGPPTSVHAALSFDLVVCLRFL